MKYWRIEIELNLENNPFYTDKNVIELYGPLVYTEKPNECFFEFKKVNYMDDCNFRYLIYPKEWIKQHKDSWKDGYVQYFVEYKSPQEVLKYIFENKKGTIINTYTNELLYQH